MSIILSSKSWVDDTFSTLNMAFWYENDQGGHGPMWFGGYIDVMQG